MRLLSNKRYLKASPPNLLVTVTSALVIIGAAIVIGLTDLTWSSFVKDADISTFFFLAAVVAFACSCWQWFVYRKPNRKDNT